MLNCNLVKPSLGREHRVGKTMARRDLVWVAVVDQENLSTQTVALLYQSGRPGVKRLIVERTFQ